MRCNNVWCGEHNPIFQTCTIKAGGCKHRILDATEGPDARRVSGASDCSDPLSGADNRAALAAKRAIQPRVAGRNPGGLRTAHTEE